MRKDQTPQGVGQTQIANQQIQRCNANGHREHETSREQRVHKRRIAEFVSGDDKAHHDAKHHDAYHGGDTHDGRILQFRPENITFEDRLVVVGDPWVRHPGRMVGDLRIGTETAEDNVQHRSDADGHKYQGEEVDDWVAPWRLG